MESVCLYVRYFGLLYFIWSMRFNSSADDFPFILRKFNFKEYCFKSLNAQQQIWFYFS